MKLTQFFQRKNHLSPFLLARIKLTLWYSLALLFVSLLLSTLYYQRTQRILSFQFDQIQRRIQRDLNNTQIYGTPPEPRMGALRHAQFLQAELKNTQLRILHLLIFINLGVVGVGGVLSFVLAGKTLVPIEKTMNQQKQFIANAAHELRTPLAAVRTSLEVAQMQKGLSKKVSSILSENVQEVDHLQQLVSHLLVLAQSDEVLSNNLPKELTQLQKILQQASAPYKEAFTEKNIKFSMPDGNLPKIKTTPTQLTQVIRILLENALKYTPPNESVSIQVTKSKHSIAIAITNTGKIISPEDLPYIFERFYRVSSARTKTRHDNDHSNTTQQPSGYGLGLAVAKTLISQLHGSLSVQSSPKTDTVFTIMLPLE